jgi:hypothetical protein
MGIFEQFGKPTMILNLPGRTAVATFVGLMLTQMGSAVAATKAGVSAAVRGVVERAAVDSGATTELHSGQDIFMGDGIKSQPRSGMQLMLLDESVFTIGPDSELTIDEFVYDPAVGAGQVTTRLTKGALRFVTGKVAKGNPQDMTVKLPAGTVGIRGTFGAVNLDGGRTYVVLLGPGANNDANSREGRLDVSAQGQTIDLTRPGFGTIIEPGQPPAPPFRFSPDQMNVVLGDARPDTKKSTDADGGDDTGSAGSSDTNDGDDTASADGAQDSSTTDTASDSDSGSAGSGDSGNSDNTGSADAVSDGGTSTSMGTAAGSGTTAAVGGVAITTDMIASDTATNDLQTQVTTDQPLSDLKDTATTPEFSITTVHRLASLNTGVLNFSIASKPFMATAGSGFENGSYDLTIDVDLGAQTIGGTGSTLSMVGDPPGGPVAAVSFQVPSMPLSSGFNGFADYHFPTIVQSSGTADCVTACTVQLDVDLFNIGTLAPGGAFSFFQLRDPGSNILGTGDGPLPNVPSAIDNYATTLLRDLAGLSTGVFHYFGQSTFVQTRTDGAVTNFVGGVKASLQIDFGARTVGGGLSGISADTVSAGGNILASTSIGAKAFPAAPADAMLDFLTMPSSNGNFSMVEAMILNDGTAVAARALIDTDYYDPSGGGQIARAGILTGLRAAGPAPGP